MPKLPGGKTAVERAWGSFGKDVRALARFGRPLGRTDEGHRRLLLAMARKMARR